MRFIFAFALLALAACSPPAQEKAPEPAVPTPAANGNAAALSSGALQEGQWVFHGDEGTVTAGFGDLESEYLLTISCEMPTGRVTITTEHELSPDQDVTMNVLTQGSTIAIPSRSFNEGLPNVYGTLDGANPALDALAERQARFATQVGASIYVFPWDEALSRVLDACGVR